MKTILSNDEGRVTALRGLFDFSPMGEKVASSVALALVSSENKIQAIVIPKGSIVSVSEGDRVKNGAVIAQWR